MTTVSVIIPTYRRASLAACLASLQRQSLAPLDIVVVDNADDPAVADRVRALNAAARHQIRYLSEPRLGQHFARNTGARAAAGDLLLFVDDDETFDADWAARYEEAFARHPGMSAAGGPLRPIWEAPPPAWLLALTETQRVYAILGLMEPFPDFRLGPEAFFWSGNMAIRRDALFAAGGFNPDLVGDDIVGDGESGLHAKLLRLGRTVGYVPGAIAYHHIPASRMTVEFVCGPRAITAVADAYARFQARMPGRPALLRECAGALAKYALFAVPAAVVRGRTRLRYLYIQQRATYYRAQCRYVARLLYDRKLREFVLQDRWL